MATFDAVEPSVPEVEPVPQADSVVTPPSVQKHNNKHRDATPLPEVVE